MGLQFMKKMLSGFCAAVLLSTILTYTSRGAVYYGNGSGGAVGDGSMSLTDSGGTVSGTFNRGASATQFGEYLVLYIDSVPNGFADTTQFSDSATSLRQIVSGFNGSARATANFAPGFAADYAIVLNPDVGCHLFRLVAGGNDSLIEPEGAVLSFNPRGDLSSPSYTFSFRLSDIGLDNSSTFRFQSGYSYSSGGRTLQSFETLSGNPYFSTVNFDNFNLYPSPVPEPANVALAIFGGLAGAGAIISKLRRRIH